MDEINKKLLTIAIDGPAASGKNTISKYLVENLKQQLNLNFVNLDTGLIYRAISHQAQNMVKKNYPNNKNIIANEIKNYAEIKKYAIQAAEELAKTIQNSKQPVKQLTDFINGFNNNQLRNPEIDQITSELATIAKLRQSLKIVQQSFCQNNEADHVNGVILDGRDIGTNVLPNANLKFFVTADPNVRAQRRSQQKFSPQQNAPANKILQAITQRDQNDQNRANNPLKVADDAIVINNTLQTPPQTCEIILNYVIKYISQKIQKTHPL